MSSGTGPVSGLSVLLLTTGLNVGGAERLVIELARSYTARGIRTVVLSLTNDRDLLDQVDTTGIDIRFIGMSKGPSGLASGARSLAKIVRNEEILVIHAHMPHAALVASTARVLFGLRTPLLHTSHNFSFARSLAIPLRATRGLRDVEVLLAPGQHPDLNARRIAVIPNGIKLEDIPQWPVSRVAGRPVLLTIGRLNEQKNLPALIQAFHEVRATGKVPGAVLRVIGDGPQRKPLEDLIERLGLSESVSLLGLRRDIPQQLAQADLFVMSSSWEGLPLVALEAGAAAVPVIAPPVGALPWLLSDDCGFLVRPEELATGIVEAWSNRDEAERRARRLSRKVREQFGHERMVQDHVKLYESLVPDL